MAEQPGGTMPAAAPAAVAADPSGAQRLRRWLDDVHRRTWELELLLSGAVVFALLRLPAAVDDAYLRLEAGLGGTLETAAFLGWYYVKLILYTLVGAFLVHLVTRAYWVGVVGLDAVFPRGPRLDKLDAGPLTRELYRRRLPSLKRQITVADRFASAVFSFAFVIVVVFLVSIVYAVALAGVAWAVSRLAFGGERFGTVFKTLVVLLFLPMVAAPLVDRVAGAKIAARGGRPAALLRRCLVISYRMSAGPLAGPIVATLLTNVKKKVFFACFAVTFVAVVGLFLVRDVLVRREALAVSSHLYLPADAGALGVDERYYADRRPAGEISFLPTIPSELVEGPYLRLFVPLSPGWAADAVAERCPEVEPVAETGLDLRLPTDPRADPAELAPVLACLGRLHELTLDGAPLEPPALFVHTDRATGVRGLLARLPAAEMAPGPHLLTVRRRPLASDRRPPQVHFIRFWR